MISRQVTEATVTALERLCERMYFTLNMTLD